MCRASGLLVFVAEFHGGDFAIILEAAFLALVVNSFCQVAFFTEQFSSSALASQCDAIH